jgi:hypothetical protein
MGYLLTGALLIVTAALTVARVVAAESDAIGFKITTNRDAGDFAIPKNLQYQLSGEHTFISGLVLGGSFQYSDTSFSNRTSQNLEGTISYQVPFNFGFSFAGTAGLGERWRENPNVSFPYYVLRIAADFALNQGLTWNVISYRFRNAFDHSNNYDTPQVATGLTFKLDGQSSVSMAVNRNWIDGRASSTGVSLGFKQRF